MAFKIIMPEMGEGIIEGTVGRWLKKEGDEIEQDEPLLEIETDKVTTEAAAEASGTLSKIIIPEGETVEVGTVLGIISNGGGDGSENGDAAAPASQVEGAAPQRESPSQPAASQDSLLESVDLDLDGRRENGDVTPYSRRTDVGWVSPVVARMAKEHDLDLTRIDGTGKNGRITKRDVLNYMESTPAGRTADREQPSSTPDLFAKPAEPALTPSPRGPGPAAGEFVPHSSLRRQIAEHMVTSKKTSPHVTTVFEADFSAVTAHRAAHKDLFAQKGVKLTFTPYLILAITDALQRHPHVNSSWQDDGLQLHSAINIGMATAINDGLIVPVIKGADGFNLLGMARAVNDLADRARTNRLKPAEVSGGTFTLTNHGVTGSLLATPIINQPQTGILGVGAIQKRVVVLTDDYGRDSMAIRPMAYLSFSFDHRTLDGASADQFVSEVKNRLETWN